MQKEKKKEKIRVRMPVLGLVLSVSRYSGKLQTRFRLEEAKFFYQQMKINFQDEMKFLYCLDAFLGSARSVTWVFQKEYSHNNSFMKWYNDKTEAWKNNKIMRFFTEMRDISVKEHTPRMRLTRVITISSNATVVDRVHVMKNDAIMPEAQPSEPAESEKEKEKEKEETVASSPETISYSFHELPRWFDGNPSVMDLCRAYLDELESFVSELESRINTSV